MAEKLTKKHEKIKLPFGNRWVEAEFNPSVLELSRMHELLSYLDKLMLMVKTGDSNYIKPCYAVQTQLLAYFYYKLPKTIREKFDALKKKIEILIAKHDRFLLHGRKNRKIEAQAIYWIIRFHDALYLFKGILGLGMTYRQKMSDADTLDIALDISEPEKPTDSEFDMPLSEEEEEDLKNILEQQEETERIEESEKEDGIKEAEKEDEDA
jgi:hypothetical protein